MKRTAVNNSAKAKKRIILFTMLVLCVDLFFIYVSKYDRKNLSITEFNPYSTGNILNFVFFIFPLLGSMVLLFKTDSTDKKYFYFLLTYNIFLTLPLIISVILREMKITVTTAYLWGYPAEKIFTACLFSVHQFLLILIGIFIWLVTFNIKKILFLRSFLYSFAVLFLLIAAAFVYDDEGIRPEEFQNSGKKSDVAVILGAAVWSKSKPSPLFASRIGKANNLYSAGIVRKLQVTGGRAPGELSEAHVAYNYLIKCGVDPDDIWLEDKTSSTSEQIAFIKERLVKEKKMKNILVVSDEFHLKRVTEICKFYNVEASGVASDLKLSWEKALLYRFRDSMALLIFWLFAI